MHQFRNLLKRLKSSEILFQASGLWPNSVVVLVSDNGGPLDHSTNSPLRGGKATEWEGGYRVEAWVHSPLLPASVAGSSYHGMMHASDWCVTALACAHVLMVCDGCRDEYYPHVQCMLERVTMYHVRSFVSLRRMNTRLEFCGRGTFGCSFPARSHVMTDPIRKRISDSLT